MLDYEALSQNARTVAGQVLPSVSGPATSCLRSTSGRIKVSDGPTRPRRLSPGDSDPKGRDQGRDVDREAARAAGGGWRAHSSGLMLPLATAAAATVAAYRYRLPPSESQTSVAGPKGRQRGRSRRAAEAVAIGGPGAPGAACSGNESLDGTGDWSEPRLRSHPYDGCGRRAWGRRASAIATPEGAVNSGS
jgi:hypothetical protein